MVLKKLQILELEFRIFNDVDISYASGTKPSNPHNMRVKMKYVVCPVPL
jgi:hypothetical protein